jgi:hypothetical protein
MYESSSAQMSVSGTYLGELTTEKLNGRWIYFLEEGKHDLTIKLWKRNDVRREHRNSLPNRTAKVRQNITL